KVHEASDDDYAPSTPPSDRLGLNEIVHITNQIFDDIAPTYKLGMLFIVSPYENTFHPYPRRESYIIGRTHKKSNHVPDIEIPHGKYTGLISRKHARLANNGKELTIEDLGSTNGTYLNGKKLEPKKRYIVDSHDIIQLSQYVPFAIRFVI
ncbi:MAG: FHA domain-containing protein, partial [Chloroflexota bacterium]